MLQRLLGEARQKLTEAAEDIEGKYPDLAQMLDEEGEQILGVYALPKEHRRRIRSTNMPEM
jgi:transposase-like protein